MPWAFSCPRGCAFPRGAALLHGEGSRGCAEGLCCAPGIYHNAAALAIGLRAGGQGQAVPGAIAGMYGGRIGGRCGSALSWAVLALEEPVKARALGAIAAAERPGGAGLREGGLARAAVLA